MILRLLLIFYLLSLGSLVLAQIDLGLCLEKKAVCFVRKSCLQGQIDEKTLEQYTGYGLKNDGVCDVIIQARAFSDKKFHISVQVKSANGPISNEGVLLKQGLNNEIQFQCTKNGESLGPNTELELESYEKRRVENDYVFCSFILLSKDSAKTITQIFENNPGYPAITFQNNVQNEITSIFEKSLLWAQIAIYKTCDPTGIETKDDNNGSHIFEKVDSTQSKIKCEDFGILQIKRKGVEYHPKELICNSLKKWSYEFLNGATTETQIIDSNTQEKIDVACVTIICALCHPLEFFNCGNGCQMMNTTNPASNTCATNTCPDNSWRVDRDHSRNATMTCRHKKGSNNPRESVWYLDPIVETSSESEEITKAACSVKADCSSVDVSGVKFECPKVAGHLILCESPIYSETKDVTCSNDSQLMLRTSKNGKPYEMSYLKCSIITGRYKDNRTNEVPFNSTAYCLKPDSAAGAAPRSAGMSFNVQITIGALAGILFLSIILTFLIYLLKTRKKSQHSKEDYNEKMRLKAEAEALRKELNPTVTVNRRMVPECDKTAWERRTTRWQQCFEQPEPDDIYLWDDESFRATVCYKFLRYDRAGRLEVLARLTAFDAYGDHNHDYYESADKNTMRKEITQYGNLRQFFTLWRYCVEHQMDDWVAWEYMWQFLRILYDGYAMYDDDRQSCKRIVLMVTDWARAMLNEFSYKRRAAEDDCDTWLRFLAVRMLMWSEAPDVLQELTRLANEPWESLESPMRAIVFAHSCRNMGRAEEFKDKHWVDIEADLQVGDPQELEKFGTKRQHLLYGLCASRDVAKRGTDEEYKTLRETLTALWNYARLNEPMYSFTPRDQLWALRGAAEFTTNMRPAIEHIVKIVPDDFEDTMTKLLEWRSKTSGVKLERLKDDWMTDLERFACLGAECCLVKSNFDDWARVISPIMAFCQRPPDPADPTGQENKPWFPIVQYQDRPYNLAALLADNRVSDYMYEAVFNKAPGLKPYQERHVQKRRGTGGYSPFDPQTVYEANPEAEAKVDAMHAEALLESDRERRERIARRKFVDEFDKNHGGGKCGPCDNCRMFLTDKQLAELEKLRKEDEDWKAGTGRYRERSAHSPSSVVENTARSPDKSLEEKTCRS